MSIRGLSGLSGLSGLFGGGAPTPEPDLVGDSIRSGAIAYWPLDSGYNDYSGNGHHLADLAVVKSGNDLHGTQPATGKVGGAAGFTEPDDPPGEPEDYSAGLIRLNTNDTFQFGGVLERSVNVWIKRAGHGLRVFGSASSSAEQYWVFFATDTVFGVIVENASEPVEVSIEATLTTGTWYMLTVTTEYHPGDEEMEEPAFVRVKLYLNGTLVSTQDSESLADTYGPGGRANVAVVDPIPDDGDYPNDPSSHFWGDVDELLFFDGVLSQEQITYLYGPEGAGRSLLV